MLKAIVSVFCYDERRSGTVEVNSLKLWSFPS